MKWIVIMVVWNLIIDIFVVRSNQTAHVKTSLVHTLHRIQKYGGYDLEYFKRMLTAEQFKACQNKSIKTWFPLTRDLLVNFIFNISILKPHDNCNHYLFGIHSTGTVTVLPRV